LKNYVMQNKAILIYATHSTDADLTDFSNQKIILKRNEKLNTVVLECGSREA
jgi:ABC-2 type transport system ATP-binding protein